MKREDFLASVGQIVNNRGGNYGKPEKNFENIADLWSVVLDQKITPAQVGQMMILLKVARLKQTPDHLDSWLDIAGYSAVSAECVCDD